MLPEGQERRQFRLGVVLNPASSRNRANSGDLERALLARGNVPVRRIVDAGQVDLAVTELLDAGSDLLVVAGGDGTVQLVLDALARRGLTRGLPPLAILPGGTTNMIAYDIGARRAPAIEFDALLSANDRGGLWQTRQTRHTIALAGTASDRPPLGFFFGAAGIVQGTKLSRRSVDRMGLRDAAGPITGLVSLVGPMLLGRNPVRPVLAGVRLDDRQLPPTNYLAIIVSTMNRLSPGIEPFWDRSPGPMRATLIRDHPRQLLRALWPGLRGRTHPALSEENGYVSRNVSRVEIDIAEETVMDGEFFRSMRGQNLVLTPGPDVVFVRG